ncbi:hypothetical protein [Yersinia kristensenii]|nr:hypothetical protein [Yersinia kristensenii]CNE41237.1 Uncharacterised protein [Yersinia kristensenii]
MRTKFKKWCMTTTVSYSSVLAVLCISELFFLGILAYLMADFFS